MLQNATVLSSLLIAAIALTSSTGCKGEPTASAASEPQPETTQVEAPEPLPPPSRRSQLQPFRGLLDEVSRAEVYVDGLFVDFGDGATHKWTMGGWKNGWGDNHDLDGTTATDIVSARVRVPLTVLEHDPAPAEIALRIRGRCDRNQTLAVRIDGDEVHSQELGEDWTEVRVKPGEALSPGYHEIGLYFRGGCDPARAQIDWLWLSEEAGADVPTGRARQEPLAVGGEPRRALLAGQPRSYRWYLTVPDEAELVFDYAADAPDAQFQVRVTRDGEATKTLFDERATAKWQEGVVDLSPLAGSTVRLELARSGGEGQAGWADPGLMVPRTEIAPPADARPQNVVLIVIDTIRADVFEPIGGEGSTVKTPAFDDLTRESTVFTNAYANENWTKPSVATILSGLYPTTHGAKKDDDTVSDGVELISERLSDEGFRTGAFVANGYVSEKYGFDQGWDFNRNYIRQSLNSDAENVYEDALEWVTEQKAEPFFLYIQTIDPHVPYRVDEKYTKLYHPDSYPRSVGSMLSGRGQQKLSKKDLSDEQLAWIKALYYGEVTYHDEQMGSFVEALRAKGMLDDTLLIITNDHGEEHKDHGRLGHGHSLYEELLRAPLLIRFPDRFEAGRQVSEPVELVDITPTILDVLGLEPSEAHDGFSWMPLLEDAPLSRPLYAVSDFLERRRAVRVGPWKMHRTTRSAKLFNVETDPGEQNDVAETALIARRMAEIHLAEMLANPDKRRRSLGTRSTKKRFDPGVVEMDPELRKQLDALGYFGDE